MKALAVFAEYEQDDLSNMYNQLASLGTLKALQLQNIIIHFKYIRV